MNDGADVWYDTISMFYRLQNLLTRFIKHRKWREYVIRALQGNPYDPTRAKRNRELIDAMHESYDRILAQPSNLLRPWATDPEKDRTLTCPTCLGVADYRDDEQAFVCRRCDARAQRARLRLGVGLGREAAR